MSGPLTGIKVVEMAGIGPAPMCAMMLSDMGAEVIRVDRVQDAGLGIAMQPEFSYLTRGRPSIAMDLKNPDAIATLLQLIASADVVLEGFRPGVMERLGLSHAQLAELTSAALSEPAEVRRAQDEIAQPPFHALQFNRVHRSSPSRAQ